MIPLFQFSDISHVHSILHPIFFCPKDTFLPRTLLATYFFQFALNVSHHRGWQPGEYSVFTRDKCLTDWFAFLVRMFFAVMSVWSLHWAGVQTWGGPERGDHYCPFAFPRDRSWGKRHVRFWQVRGYRTIVSMHQLLGSARIAAVLQTHVCSVRSGKYVRSIQCSRNQRRLGVGVVVVYGVQ